MKKLVMFGMLIGSTIGGFVPGLWGDSMFSFSSVILTFFGGVIGIWAGYRVAKW